MLFLAERIVMAAPLEERLARPRELSQPVVEGLRQWVEEELRQQIPGSPAHKALKYLDNQWSRLVVFLETAKIACHNNDTERDLRRPVKGKANFHYARSERGARAMAVYYSLLGTCLLQGINPLRYLKEILGRLDEPPSALTPYAIRYGLRQGGKTSVVGCVMSVLDEAPGGRRHGRPTESAGSGRGGIAARSLVDERVVASSLQR